MSLLVTAHRFLLWCESLQQIRWDLVRKLYNVQEREGIRAGNRLTKSHIEYSNNKMKVKLAAQTLSRSTAMGLRLCKDLKVEGFESVDATCDYILHMDR